MNSSHAKQCFTTIPIDPRFLGLTRYRCSRQRCEYGIYIYIYLFIYLYIAAATIYFSNQFSAAFIREGRLLESGVSLTH